MKEPETTSGAEAKIGPASLESKAAPPHAEAAASGEAGAIEEKDRLLDHNYDGIQEYDNPLPGWWFWLFVASIVFSPFYAVYYHVGRGDLVLEEYEKETAYYSSIAEEAAVEAAEARSEDTLAALQQDAQAMQAAADQFQSLCASCHEPQGQGKIGPNLTDDHWIHGGNLMDIRQTIHDGVPSKGMVPWGGSLPPEEIDRLAAYVGTLGAEYVEGKEPQGEPFEYTGPGVRGGGEAPAVERSE